MIRFLVPASQAFGLADYLATAGTALAPRFQLVPYEGLPQCRELPTGRYVFSALDQLRPEALLAATRLAEHLRSAGCAPPLNWPTDTLCRFELLETLHRAGINPHRAVRATDDFTRLTFPAFVREEHGHNGALTPLLDSTDAIRDAVRTLGRRGFRAEDLLAVEFADSRGSDGYYRKYAAFVVGDRIVARSLARGPTWMLKHEDSEFTEALIDEEFEYVRDNPHAEELRRIAAIAKVGYGRIDYAIKDGRVVVWEINLNPTIGRRLNRPPGGKLTPELRARREPTRDAFANAFQAAWAEVDVDSAGSGLANPLSPADRAMLAAPLRVLRRPPSPLVRALPGPVRAVARFLLRSIGR